MKVNKESEKLYKELVKRFGDILSKYCIIDKILEAEDAKTCKIELTKIYLEELQSSWN